MNFQIKQCEIKIEYLFFAVIAFLLFTDTTGVALLGIAATVLHEAGHLVMMLLLGSSVKTVRFHAFGVDIEETGRGRRSYLSDALVALAGPFANMIFCVASAVLYSFSGATIWFGNLFLLTVPSLGSIYCLWKLWMEVRLFMHYYAINFLRKHQKQLLLSFLFWHCFL